MQSIPGVIDAESGYANGTGEQDANYSAVCAGDTGFRETVRVEYDPERVSLDALLLAYFYRSISLVGTQVYQKAYGTGIVVQQNVNMIRVRFGNLEKQYIISKKFPMRPTFEDDTEILEALNDYEIKLKELDSLKKKLATM